MKKYQNFLSEIFHFWWFYFLYIWIGMFRNGQISVKTVKPVLSKRQKESQKVIAKDICLLNTSNFTFIFV